jgi:hypothetical protein
MRLWWATGPLSRSTAWPLTGRFYSGKHRRHGMNLQVISSLAGEILWVSGPLPGAEHDRGPDLGHHRRTRRCRVNHLRR